MLRYVLNKVDVLASTDLRAARDVTDDEVRLMLELEVLVERNERIVRGRPGEMGTGLVCVADAGVECRPNLAETRRDALAVIAAGEGDVDELVAWRCAELRRAGVRAMPMIVRTELAGAGVAYTARVLLPDGKEESVEGFAR